MNLLIIGGMHGNERLGIELVELLQAKPLQNVDTVIANPEAVQQNCRYIESDLNRSFGITDIETLETRRAAELTMRTKQYDVVLDFHSTQTPGNNCSFVGVGCRPVLYDVIRSVGLGQCVEATYDCINKYCDNTISIEISVEDPFNDSSVWYEKIASLVAGGVLDTTSDLSVYRFRRRVTWDEKALYGFDEWQPFMQLTEADKMKLTISGEIVPIFIGSKLTEYYATLLEKTGVNV